MGRSRSLALSSPFLSLTLYFIPDPKPTHAQMGRDHFVSNYSSPSTSVQSSRSTRQSTPSDRVYFRSGAIAQTDHEIFQDGGRLKVKCYEGSCSGNDWWRTTLSGTCVNIIMVERGKQEVALYSVLILEWNDGRPAARVIDWCGTNARTMPGSWACRIYFVSHIYYISPVYYLSCILSLL